MSEGIVSRRLYRKVSEPGGRKADSSGFAFCFSVLYGATAAKQRNDSYAGSQRQPKTLNLSTDCHIQSCLKPHNTAASHS